MTTDKEDRIATGIVIGMMLISVLLFAFILTSCQAKRVVVTEYRDRQVHDTTQIVDSVWRDRWHVEYVKGDTIYIHDSVFVDRYKYRDKVVERVDVDSIPYAVEVVREVPRKRSGYDKFCSTFFWIVVVLLLLVGAFKVCDKIPATKPYTSIIKRLFRL